MIRVNKTPLGRDFQIVQQGRTYYAGALPAEPDPNDPHAVERVTLLYHTMNALHRSINEGFGWIGEEAAEAARIHITRAAALLDHAGQGELAGEFARMAKRIR